VWGVLDMVVVVIYKTVLALLGFVSLIWGGYDIYRSTKGYGVKPYHLVYVKPKKATDNEQMWLMLWGSAPYLSGSCIII